MAGTTTGNWWEYSRWTKNIARNARITYPTGTEATLYRAVVASFCDPVDGTGTRPWLTNKFNRLSVTANGSNYQFSYALEPMPVIVKAMEAIGVDLKKIPITAAEKYIMDVTFLYQEYLWGYYRRHGAGPLFGGVGGSGTTPVIPES